MVEKTNSLKLLFTSYSSSTEYSDPVEWLYRIAFYTGILESLSDRYTVTGIERINYEGSHFKNGVQYYFIRLKSKVVLFPRRLHQSIKNLQPDVVFINGFIFPLQILQLKLKLGRRIKIVVINRSEKPFNGIKKYLQKTASRYVDAFIFTSHEFATQWIANGNIGKQKKVYEVLHGSSIFSVEDKAMARASLNISGSPIFLWVGRLNKNKDPVTVVKSFIAFLSFKPAAKLYMIFHTEELLKELQALIQQNEKAIAAIMLVGKVDHEKLQHWYSASDFIISGSHYEGGGIAIAEGLSCGCIPILTDIMAFRELTGRGKYGLLYQPGNINELFKTLLKTNELNIEAERNKVLQRFQEEFSFKAIANKIDAIITTL